jgi:pantothenate kinase
MSATLLDQARPHVRARLADSSRARILVGIAGPPGAGKSTLAEALAAELATAGTTVAVPMDGFHLSNVELERLGLADRKGAPSTFDSAGFVHLLHRLRAREELVYAPAYSRVVHESIGGVIPVPASVRLVVVEGNYLLEWPRARELFDLTLYVDIDPGVRLERLLRRQREFGLSAERAHDWVHRSDEDNARVVAATRHLADVVLTAPAPD